MGGRPAAGGGRWIGVAPERLPRWLDNFAARHGSYTAYGLTVTAEDGATARLEPPPGTQPVRRVEDLVRTAPQARRLGLVLARKGAVAVGVADGPDLVASKVDTHYVQGRTAAGGWSQQRFARRRDNQARAAAADGAAVVRRLLVPQVRTLHAIVAGGDRSAVEAILGAPDLAGVRDLLHERFLDVPEPRHTVLAAAVSEARAVRILVRDP